MRERQHLAVWTAGDPPRTTARRPLRERLRSGWREFRSMRTALILLFLLASASVFGSVFPQTPISSQRVAQYIQDHPLIGPLLERMGMFNVFGSVWFTAIYIGLVVALSACLLPRIAAHVRVLRARPRAAGAALQRYRNHATLETTLEPEAAVAAANGVLRRRRFRTSVTAATVASEKGYLREGGSVVFHLSILVLLLGIAYGAGFGYRGQTSIVVGDTWANARVNYDVYSSGRFYSPGDLPDFNLRLDAFHNGFYPNGTPMEFVSKITATNAAGKVLEYQAVQPNRPMTVDGVRVFQADYGYAPVIRVTTASGQVLQNGPVVMLRNTTNEISSGAVKLPSLNPQVGLVLTFFTGLERVAVPGGGNQFINVPEMVDPVLLVQPFAGNLEANGPQSVFTVNTDKMKPLGDLPLLVRPGHAIRLADGLRVSLGGIRQYSILTLSRDPGVPFAAGAAVLLFVGLLASLYVTRRRVWARAERADGATRVELAGLAMQGKDRFEREFSSIVEEVETALRSPTAGDGSTLGHRVAAVGAGVVDEE